MTKNLNDFKGTSEYRSQKKDIQSNTCNTSSRKA